MLNMPGDSPNNAKIFRYKEYENITKKPLAEWRPAPRQQQKGFQSRWIICASASMSWKLLQMKIKIDGTNKKSGIKDLMNWIFCWVFHQKWHHLRFVSCEPDRPDRPSRKPGLCQASFKRWSWNLPKRSSGKGLPWWSFPQKNSDGWLENPQWMKLVVFPIENMVIDVPLWCEFLGGSGIFWRWWFN